MISVRLEVRLRAGRPIGVRLSFLSYYSTFYLEEKDI
jgi:hypothetical protein